MSDFNTMLATLETLATRNHDRACAHLSDTRLICNCGTNLHNAKVKGTAIKMTEMFKSIGEPVANAPITNVTESVGVRVVQPIPGSPALQQPTAVQQPTSVDIPTRVAGEQTALEELPPVAEIAPGTRPPEAIIPPMEMPAIPGAMEMHAPPARAPEKPPVRVVGHGPLKGEQAQRRMQKEAVAS